MGRKPKSDGYIVRRQLNAIERANVAINRVLEQVLVCESVQVRAILIAQAAIAVNKSGSACGALTAILLYEADDDHIDSN